MTAKRKATQRVPAPTTTVAAEATLPPSAPQAAPEPAAPAEAGPATPEAIRCVTCGKRAVYETDGRAAASRAYCRRDLPANVTPAMVREYELFSRQ